MESPLARLSVIVITKNEEPNVRECLESAKWADEIIVVDAGSTDKTVQIARKFTRNVFVRPWEGFGRAKNFALNHCSGDWILWLDADERVAPGLATEIRNVISSGDQPFQGYSVPRKAFFLGKWIRHCGWYPGRVVRLFRKGAGSFTTHSVHERLTLRGKEGKLKTDLLHFTDPSLFHYFEKFNRYTSLAADDRTDHGWRPGAGDLLLRPLWTFFRMYVFKLGFLDGVHGFILCSNSAFYVFTKYAKSWERTKETSSRGTYK